MTKRMNKVLSFFLTLVFVFTLGVGGRTSRASAAELNQNSLKQSIFEKHGGAFSAQDVRNYLAQKTGRDLNESGENSDPKGNPDEVVRVIVQLKDKPAYGTTGATIQSVASSQASVISKAKAVTGSKVENTFTYFVNGFSMDVKRADINKLKKITGVKKVTEARKYTVDLNAAKSLTQAYSVWQDLGYKGEGMVVAVLDSGIDPSHKDMVLTDPSKAALSEVDVNDKIADLNLTGKSGKYFTAKVPFGYNYADKNQDIVDTNPDTGMHGMHVAGIVGANGNEEEIADNKAVKGVAPEVQLLAMKVFSNTDRYAYEDAIVAAIEDSALLGADVINMSLGATAGFQDDTDPEQVAIKNATDAGVVVVVSAGNSYYSTHDIGNFSGYGLYDTGLTGSPGIAKDALSVASYENTVVTLPALSYAAGSDSGVIGYTTSDVDPLAKLTDPNGYELIDCGIGAESDFEGKDLTGKIALIQRGSLDFVTKKLNAQYAGAVGAIVYNSVAGGDTYINMATDSEITIPGIFVTLTDGNKLKSLIGSGLKVSFKEGTVTVVPNANAGDMSDFTSWGPTPDLAFKPQITAPGGNIFSTVNGNKYETMSGTSMAAPHTAGSEALILQALKERVKNGEMHFDTPRDMVNFAKDTAINTSAPQLDKYHNTVPYSPRRQGAGLIQIENAINNKVLVKDNSGSTTVALKEIGKHTTFDLNLTNYGTTDAEYTVNTLGGLLTGTTDYLNPDGKSYLTMPFDVVAADGSLSFDKESVTVPAGGTAKVTVSISLTDSMLTDQFIEGFVRFTSVDPGAPSVGVPFVGFYGHWNDEQIVDAPMWDRYNTWYGTTTLLTLIDLGFGEIPYYMGFTGVDENSLPMVDPEKMAISPNDDGFWDKAFPYVWMLRNAKQMKVEVLDSNNNIVRTLTAPEGYDKDIRKNYDAVAEPGTFLDQFTWDGKLDNGNVAPEGQYNMKISSLLDFPGAEWQTLTMPVKVDVTQPQFTITSSDVTKTSNYTLTMNVSDNLSGFDAADSIILVNDEVADTTQATVEDGVFSLPLELSDGENDIAVLPCDYAVNYSDPQFLTVTVDTTAPGKPEISVNTTQPTNKDVTVTLAGNSADEDVAALKYSFDKTTWNVYSKPFKVSENKTVYAVAVDAAGNESEAAELAIGNIDKAAPSAPVITVDNTEATNTDVNVTITSNVDDKDVAKLEYSFDGQKWTRYTNTLVVKANTKVYARATDNAGNVSIVAQVDVSNIDKTAPIKPEVTLSTTDPTNGDVTVTITAEENAVIEYRLDGQKNWTLYTAPFAVNKNTKVYVRVTDAAGNVSETAETAIDNIDKTAPEKPSVSVSTEAKTNGDVTVTIKAEEDTKVEYRLDGQDNWTVYTAPFTVSKNTKVYVRTVDAAGNVSVVVEKTITNIDKSMSSLPKTGSVVDMNVLLGFGALIAALGSLLILLQGRKRNDDINI